MKALILCGGKGTRLRPLTYTRSKQMLPVGNRPIVEYVLRHVAAAKIKDVGVILSPSTDTEIKEFFEKSSFVRDAGMKLTFIMQAEPLGLAHAVQTAKPFLKNDPFVMYLGDNLLKEGLIASRETFTREKLDALVTLKEVDNPQAFGVAVLDKQGNIKKLVEKPKERLSPYALVGVYFFSPRIHEAIAQIKPSWRGELEITDAIQKLLDIGGKVKGEILQSWWLDTGKKDDMLSANSVVLDEYTKTEILGQVDEKSKISGRVSVGNGSRVINSTVRGPVAVGNNVEIVDSFIGPYSSIGDESKINSSSIEHSVILRGARINGVPRLEDSLIGEETQVIKTNHKREALRLMLGDSAVVEI